MSELDKDIHANNNNNTNHKNQIKLNESKEIKKNTNFLNSINCSINDLINGFLDSLQIFTIFDIVYNSEKILLNLRNCILLNGLILISSNIFFIYLLEPFFNYVGNLTPFGYFSSMGKYFYIIFIEYNYLRL